MHPQVFHVTRATVQIVVLVVVVSSCRRRRVLALVPVVPCSRNVVVVTMHGTILVQHIDMHVPSQTTCVNLKSLHPLQPSLLLSLL